MCACRRGGCKSCDGKGLPKGVCLNVNIPKCDKVAGIKTARAAEGYWTEEYAEYTDPHNRPYYWLTGRFHNAEPDARDTDLYWTDRGYASIVPYRPDQTAYTDISAIKSLFRIDRICRLCKFNRKVSAILII